MLKAAEQALRGLRRPEDVAKARGKSVRDVLPYRREVDADAPAAAVPPAAAETPAPGGAETPASAAAPEEASDGEA